MRCSPAWPWSLEGAAPGPERTAGHDTLVCLGQL